MTIELVEDPDPRADFPEPTNENFQDALNAIALKLVYVSERIGSEFEDVNIYPGTTEAALLGGVEVMVKQRFYSFLKQFTAD